MNGSRGWPRADSPALSVMRREGCAEPGGICRGSVGRRGLVRSRPRPAPSVGWGESVSGVLRRPDMRHRSASG